eukprot:15924898-Heterocapsa_arctica.AAC.1
MPIPAVDQITHGRSDDLAPDNGPQWACVADTIHMFSRHAHNLPHEKLTHSILLLPRKTHAYITSEPHN